MDLRGICELKSIAGFYSGGAILVEATGGSNPLCYVADRLGNDDILIVLEAMATWLTPTELEDWCSRCSFSAGKTPEIVLINRGFILIQTLLNKRRDF